MNAKSLNFEQMESIEGGAPCWLQATALLGAGIGLAAGAVSSGGLAVIAGGGVWAAAYVDWVNECYIE